MSTPPTSLLRTAIAALSTAIVAPLALAAAPASAAGDLYVGAGGSDRATGTRAAPLGTVQAAVDRAKPGTTIRLLPGTYSGNVKIRTSGTAAAPIRLTASTPGTVRLTYNSAPQPCNNSQPAADRTVTIGDGADYWTIDNLAIHNGIWISGKQSNVAYNWLTNLVNKRDWATRRRVPGHSAYDPAAALGSIPYLRAVTKSPEMDASVGVKILNNTLTGRGIYGALTSYGNISGNRISQIPCGIGPGIWLMTFSNGWTIANNDVSDIAISKAAHFMQEGIRIGSAADYNTVTGNYVHDLPGDGRGINTDVDASFNSIHHNRVHNVAIGYNDQMSGWNNRWEYNVVTNYRTYGFGFRLMDAPLATPSLASSSNLSVVRCNVASGGIGNAKALGAGALLNATFTSNRFPVIWLGSNLQRYWGTYNNKWNGSSATPSTTPAAQTLGC